MQPSRLTCACPRCGHGLWAERAGEWTLQNRIVKLAPDGGLVAKCPQCATDVPIPFLRIDWPADPPKSPTGPPRVRQRMIVRLDKSRMP